MSTTTHISPSGSATVTIDIEIDAPSHDTWKHMIEDIRDWWRSDFLICDESRGMHLQPKVGGLLLEKGSGEDTGFTWGQIIRYEPDEHLAFIAQIVPPWGGPAQSVVQISLAPGAERPDATTKLTLSDSLIGNVTEELLATVEEGWRQLFGDGGLKSFVESK